MNILQRRTLIVLFILLPFAAFAQDTVNEQKKEERRIRRHARREAFMQRIRPENVPLTKEVSHEVIDQNTPSFGVYKDIYFISGIPLNNDINSNTADAMYQISFRQRLSNSVLPFNSFAYLTYTQKSFWDVYAESSPFYDNNYNPGIGFGRYIIRDNKLVGGTFTQLKHESNGQDSIKSRSWNYLDLFAKYFFHTRLAMSLEIWIPFLVDKDGNKDLLDYRGYGIITVNHITRNHKWWFSSYLNPRRGLGNFNMQASVSFRVSKNFNQYLFAQVYSGYAEGLMDYNQHHFNFRIGICVKPDFFSVY